MRSGFLWVVLTILAAWVFATGCGGDDDDSGGSADDDATDDDTTDDDTADDDSGDDDTGTTTTTTVTTTTTTTTTTVPDLAFEDFESYTVGENPPAPWTIFEYGANNVEVVDGIAKDGSGKLLKYAAGADAGDFGNAAMEILAGEDATFSFDIYRNPGASMHFMMSFNDGSWLEEVILDIVGATETLHAWTPASVADDIECADLPTNEWIKISVEYRYVDGQYDVLVNDENTDCMDLDVLQDAGQPFKMLQWMDSTDVGVGGTFYLDNIRVRAVE